MSAHRIAGERILRTISRLLLAKNDEMARDMLAGKPPFAVDADLARKMGAVGYAWNPFAGEWRIKQ